MHHNSFKEEERKTNIDEGKSSAVERENCRAIPHGFQRTIFRLRKLITWYGRKALKKPPQKKIHRGRANYWRIFFHFHVVFGKTHGS